MDAARARKVADRISEIVAEMLERRIKDPRLGFVTVTEARLTNDLREATVYYTVLGTDAERADTAMALARATGIIRSAAGRPPRPLPPPHPPRPQGPTTTKRPRPPSADDQRQRRPGHRGQARRPDLA